MFKTAEKPELDYFKALYYQMENGGTEAMMYDLMNIDLKDWNPRYDIPQNSELEDQKTLSIKLNPELNVILQILVDGILPISESNIINGGYFVPISSIREYAKTFYSNNIYTSYKFNTEFNRLGFLKYRTKYDRGYIFPLLPKARQLWDENNSRVEWSNENEEWIFSRDNERKY